MKTQNPTQTEHASYYDFKGLGDWYEIFEGGEQVASNGAVVNLSESDLDKIIANSTGKDIPLVTGHPKDNDPAYGWSNEYMRKGKKLLTRSHSYADEFSTAVENKHFPNRSISLEKTDDGYRVRHIAFLGAVPPAVKTLSGIDFKDSDAEHLTFDFSMNANERHEVSYALSNVADLFRKWRDRYIDKYSLKEADELIPDWEVKSIERSAEEIKNANNTSNDFSESRAIHNQHTHTQTTGDNIVAFSEEQTQAIADENAKLKEQLATAQKTQAAKDRAHNFSEAQAEAKEVIAPLLNQGKLLPVNLKGDGLVNFMAHLKVIDEKESVFEFSSSAGKSNDVEKTSIYDFAVDLIKNLGPQINLGKDESEDAGDEHGGSCDFNGYVVDQEKLDFTKKAEALATDKKISFAEAVSQLSIEQEA